MKATTKKKKSSSKKARRNKPPLRILFDARMIQHSGIGTYITNILNSLYKLPKIKLRVLGSADKILQNVPAFKGQITYFDTPIYSMGEQIKYPRPASDEILHVPHYNAPLRYLKQSIVTVHDLIHLKSSQFRLPHYRLYCHTLLRFIAKNALHILTISEATRQDFLSYFPSAENKITVIYNGFAPEDFQLAKNLHRKNNFQKYHNLPSEYLLHVGIDKKHKNVDFLVRAFASEWHSGRLTMPLVLAGCGGKLPAYVEKHVTKLKVEKYIHVMPHLSKPGLGLLYTGAKVFLYPSLWEGFGFPILESLACGTPTLSSNASVLPETGGDAVIYFNPYNEGELRLQLYTLLSKPDLYRKFVTYGKQYAKRYSWKQHIQSLMSVYTKIAK